MATMGDFKQKMLHKKWQNKHKKPMNTNLNVDVNTLETDFCDCGCPIYRTRTISKILPNILIGSLKKEYININYLACEKCGKPHKSVDERISDMVKSVFEKAKAKNTDHP